MSLHPTNLRTAAVVASSAVTPSVQASGQIQNQGGRTVNMPIVAGGTVRINSAGTMAYLIVASAPVNMRPDGGDFVLYQQGTGINTNNVQFSVIEIQNPNDVPIVVSLWVGFAGFIDNRLITANVVTPNVAFPTYPAPNAGTVVNINDLSGGPFTDIDGNKWFAIYRIAILVFNNDTGVSLQLQKAGSVVSNGPAIGTIFPGTAIRFDVSGNYCLSVGGGNINATVSEIYSAVSAQ